MDTCTLIVWAAVKHDKGPESFCRAPYKVYCFGFTPAGPQSAFRSWHCISSQLP